MLDTAITQIDLDIIDRMYNWHLPERVTVATREHESQLFGWRLPSCYATNRQRVLARIEGVHRAHAELAWGGKLGGYVY